MAMLLEQNQSPDRNRAELYNQVFQLLLEGANRCWIRRGGRRRTR